MDCNYTNLDFSFELEDLDSIPKQDLLNRSAAVAKYKEKINLDPEYVISESREYLIKAIEDLGLNEEQKKICMEIRRKGKNKMHALNCRNKSQNEMADLERRVSIARETNVMKKAELSRLTEEKKRLDREYNQLMIKNLDFSLQSMLKY